MRFFLPFLLQVICRNLSVQLSIRYFPYFPYFPLSFLISEFDPNHVVSLAIIVRKSALNPGTRYHARGLNDEAGAGNEAEEEQIVFGDRPDGIRFTSWVLRRGTVPLHWYTYLRTKFSEPEIRMGEKPFDGVERYWLRFVERYDNIPVTAVSLLKSTPDSIEAPLIEVGSLSLSLFLFFLFWSSLSEFASTILVSVFVLSQSTCSAYLFLSSPLRPPSFLFFYSDVELSTVFASGQRSCGISWASCELQLA